MSSVGWHTLTMGSNTGWTWLLTGCGSIIREPHYNNFTSCFVHQAPICYYGFAHCRRVMLCSLGKLHLSTFHQRKHGATEPVCFITWAGANCKGQCWGCCACDSSMFIPSHVLHLAVPQPRSRPV